jgi:hypothetical protein
MSSNNENIFFYLDEETNDNIINEEVDYSYVDEIDNKIYYYQYDLENNDKVVALYSQYKLNYNVKELLLITEYYGIAKELKIKKCNKELIIQFIVDFESNPINDQIVVKRQKMWFYINELKNDKFMKKYVLW